MKKLFLLFVYCFFSVFLIVGCVPEVPPANITYIEATPAPDLEPEKIVVTVHEPMPLPGQMKPKPSLIDDEPENSSAPAKTYEVIESANAGARSMPDMDNYYNSLMRYSYAEGALYQVYSAPLKFTDIQLQPGERLLGDGPICGDTVRWVMEMGESRVDGIVQEHIYLKPTQPSLNTTFTINTDRRTYHLEIHSFKETYMAAVRWRYPQDEVRKIRSRISDRKHKEEAVTSTIVSLDKVNNNYEIKLVEGDKKPVWSPTIVFDDGRKTFIKFSPEMLNRESPVLFVVSSEDETQLVNYRVKNDYYIVDRLFSIAELRLGQQNQTVVRLVKLAD